jgi:hypothetical protein
MVTLEPDVDGRRDTPANRMEAARLLTGFAARVTALGRDSASCQFNVYYSMRPEAGAWIDSQRALEKGYLCRSPKKSKSL